MNWLESLAQPFIWHPARAACVGLAWLGVSLVLPKAARLPLLVAAVGWGVFAALEFEAWRERANIRIDLPVTWPPSASLRQAAWPSPSSGSPRGVSRGLTGGRRSFAERYDDLGDVLPKRIGTERRRAV